MRCARVNPFRSNRQKFLAWQNSAEQNYQLFLFFCRCHNIDRANPWQVTTPLGIATLRRQQCQAHTEFLDWHFRPRAQYAFLQPFSLLLRLYHDAKMIEALLPATHSEASLSKQEATQFWEHWLQLSLVTKQTATSLLAKKSKSSE